MWTLFCADSGRFGCPFAPTRCGGGVVSAGVPRFVSCGSSTPPTGTWVVRSTAWDCSTHQAAFVDHLLEVVEAERVDLVVVAGDIYDRALPHVDAVRLADETLARLAASRARVVLTSRQPRLRPAPRLRLPADRRRRRPPPHRRLRVGTPVLLDDEHGPVAVHGLPYLDPQALHEPVAAVGAQPRGGPRRGDAPGPRRPRGAPDAVRRPGPCVRDRRPAQRLRARHQRRWRLPWWRRRSSTDISLHRARPPARPARCSTTRCATAAPRWPTPSPRPTTPRAAGWSTSVATASTPSSSSRRRCPGGWRG